MNDATEKHEHQAVEAFIDRWQHAGGKETLPASESARYGTVWVRVAPLLRLGLT